MTLAHMGGIHGQAVVWMPLVMGIGLWLVMRTGKEEPSEEEDHRGVGGAVRAGGGFNGNNRPRNGIPTWSKHQRYRGPRGRVHFVAPPVGSRTN